MVVGDQTRSVDVLVVGCGPGGSTLALELAAVGRDVLVVERDQVGGTCLNVGCIPSKALLHVADAHAMSAEAEQWGVKMSASVDLSVVQQWMSTVVDGLSASLVRSLKHAGVEVLRGDLAFIEPHRAVITREHGAEFVRFDVVVLATGSRPIGMDPLPFDGGRIVDSTGLLTTTSLPADLLVVGGGYIGVELGTAFAKLGSATTIVEVADRLLPGLDPALVRPVTQRLGELGVRVITGAHVVGASAATVEITVDHEASAIVLEPDRIVVAAGRRPNTDAIGLELLGVQLEPSGHVRVDDQCRAAAGVFALGDVCSGPALAHRASAQAEVVARVLGGGSEVFDPSCIPVVVYSDPEILTVGDAAHAPTRRHVVVPWSASGRAWTLGRTEGRLELVFNAVDHVVVGLHAVGAGVAELAGEAALAIELRATVDDLALSIHPHPTMNESIQQAARLAARAKP